MKKLIMDKAISVVDSEKKTMNVSVHSYKELATICENEKTIEVKYPLGLLKRRRKQLTELGYKLEKELHYEATEPHHSVNEIWTKGKTFVSRLNSEGNEVIIIREIGTTATIEEESVQVNQMKWNAKNDYDYNSVRLTKQEILDLADHIRKSESATINN